MRAFRPVNSRRRSLFDARTGSGLPVIGYFILFVFLSLAGSLAPLGIAQESDPEDSAQAAPVESEDSSEDRPVLPANESEPASEDADEAENDEAVPDGASGKKSVVYGKIDGEINMAESAFVNRLLEEAKAADADILLLEINTFGGRVDAAVAIRDALMDAPHETVIFINKRAISAGALISLACERIAISPGGTIGAATPVSSSPGQEVPEAVQEKYLSYFRQEMRSTAESRGRDGDIAEALVDKDKEVPELSEKGKLLTLTTKTALEHGFADFEADSLEAVLAEIGGRVADMESVDRSWSENLAAFLTSQAIASMLMLGMMVFGYLEYQTPGFGFFGGIAIFCFVLLYFSHYLVNLAGHEELILFGLGVILLVVEMLVLPGAAIFGTLGAMCVLASLVLLLMAGDWSDISLENPFTMEAMEWVAMSIVGSGFVMVGLARFVLMPVKGEGSRGGLLLQKELTADQGFSSHEEDPEAESWVGKTGRAVTQLRPAGKALIEGRRVNVETEGEFIAKDESIVVLRRVEGRIVVAGAPAAGAPAAGSPAAEAVGQDSKLSELGDSEPNASEPKTEEKG